MTGRAACLALGVLTLLGRLAGAHPMGNFSVNRYARLEPSRSGLNLLYIVDFAEIPTFQEISKSPALTQNLSPDFLNHAAEADRLKHDLAAEWLPNLRVTADGESLHLGRRSSSLLFSQGVGGLPTMKLEMRLFTPWRATSGALAIRYDDANEPERLGWREVVLRTPPDLRVLSAGAPSQDISHALTSYPLDPTADIPHQTTAELKIVLPTPEARAVRPAPQLPPPEAEAVVRPTAPPPPRTDRLAALVSQKAFSPGVVMLSLAIAFCLGGLHALSPGHGKTIVAAYLVGSRGTPKHALLLGAVVTASHTIGVFLLGFVTLALSKAIVPEKLYPAIQFLSGLSIVIIGTLLFHKRLRSARSPAHSHGGLGEHTHASGDNHGHSHEIPAGAPTASALLALGVSGGILPCPSALVVLLSAIALHRIGLGLVLIVAFSAGLASVLSGIGILVVRAGKVLSRFDSAGAWMRRLPAVSALLVGILGLAIAGKALGEVHRIFF
jgi:ABC-type nickel/cobalt efflux system permease component RcnA